MKKIFFLTLLLFTFFQGFSDGGFNYQAVVRGADGTPLIDETVIMKFEIAASNSTFYTESHTVTTNAFGLVNVVIGEGSTSDDFSSITWGGKYDLIVSINGEVFDSQRMQSVPYALYANNGITTTQADAITANTAKTGITTSQADAITANTAKTGITTTQADAITANSAKVGISESDKNIGVGSTSLDAVTTSDNGTAVGYNALTLSLIHISEPTRPY